MSISNNNENINEYPVLIIGGSLVGLSVSMFLAMHGIKSLIIEKHQGTAIHPRAGYFQLRTLEMLRQAGIEDKVIKAAHALYDPNGGMNAVETLAGREIANYIPDINQGIQDLTPVRRLFMPQQVLEPIIKDRAKELGSAFLYAHKVNNFSQDEQGVYLEAEHIDDKSKKSFRGRYLIACDGSRSPVRNQLGIKMNGYPVMSQSITVYFKADCSKALRGRNLGVIYVNNENVRGFFRLEKTCSFLTKNSACLTERFLLTIIFASLILSGTLTKHLACPEVNNPSEIIFFISSGKPASLSVLAI